MAGFDFHRILCRSEGREEKDRATREKQEAKLLVDLGKLQQRVSKGQLQEEKKIQQAIGRLRERYPRVVGVWGAMEQKTGLRVVIGGAFLSQWS